MKVGVKINPWVVAVFDSCCYIAQQLMESCCKRDMRMWQAAVVEKELPNVANFAPEQRAEKMIGALKQHKPVFVLVILPDKDNPIYSKQLLNRKQGAHLY